MAYQTGTVASPTALKSVIETFCTSNGWSLVSSWLSKGLSNIRLNVSGTTTLSLSAANSSDGLTTPYAYSPYIYIAEVNWPVTYYMFVHANPDLLVCVLQYATNKIQPIIFGDIKKVHDSAFVGGNWLFAPKYAVAQQANEGELYEITDLLIRCSSFIANNNPGVVLPFSSMGSSNPDNNRNSAIHAEIDGVVWANSIQLDMTPAAGKIRLADYTISELFRSPNTWNSQANLVPIHLHFTALSSLVMYLGYVEHLRFIRVDNYEIGDIVTLGPDKWKVFPWGSKNTTYRNGNAATVGTGTLGFAVSYDGP